MKLADIKSALLPHKYFSHKSRNVKTACILLLCAYVIAFLCITFSVKNFTGDIYSDITEFIYSADDFYLVGDKFTFISEQNSCYVQNIDFVLTVDSNADYHDVPESTDRTPLIFAFVAGNGIYVNFDGFEYSASISEIFNEVGEFDFTKTYISGYLSGNTNIIFNLVFSVLVFIALLFVFVVLIAVLLISLIVRAVKSLIKCQLDFKQVMFISIGSLIYPILFSGIVFVFPNSILFIAVYFFDILRLLIAAVLLYVLFAMYPFFESSSKDSTVKE